MKPIKLVGILLLILLLISLIVVAGVLIYKITNKNPEPTPTTAIVTSSNVVTNSVSLPANRNTIYQIKGEFVRYDPDLYTGAIAKNSSQHPDYVKLVHPHGHKKHHHHED